jgi:hypothetical protein
MVEKRIWGPNQMDFLAPKELGIPANSRSESLRVPVALAMTPTFG